MIPVKILCQPDDTTCGPTSLHAVYHYFGDKVSLEEVINAVPFLESGGTLNVLLACDALKRGYSATIYNYNLKLFDPTWFELSSGQIIQKLKEQARVKTSKRLQRATVAYIEFLELGGTLMFRDLTPALLVELSAEEVPVLTGLSATYLYGCARERTNEKNLSIYDDIKGYPMGHFVVLCGMHQDKEQIIVADPFQGNPVSGDSYYSVDIQRLINSIMLGILTYDANLLIIKPPKKDHA